MQIMLRKMKKAVIPHCFEHAKVWKHVKAVHGISIVVQSNHMCGSKSMFVELDESVGGDIIFARKDMMKGLSYVKHPDQFCEGCLCGKQSRKSFPQESSSRARSPLEEKSEVFGMFKRFKALVEKESSYYIKALRSDRGGEFTSNEFKTFCAENGIRRPMAVSFTPQ
ncbi:T26F17.17 [Cucumis melo var. makuwa]|uniref:T26F17.17 n=1 Tax=Cucumis melo var. makuwa TaxID=1194695 RepID=A0A5A7TZV3_CUCMM|nr:T26F17.17 [Cucumis melo var. makuwa]